MKKEERDTLILALMIIIIFAGFVTLINKSISISGNVVAKPNCMLGDVNNDKSIDPKDLVIIDKIISGEIPKTLCADADGNGQINQADRDLLRSRMII